MGQMYEELIAEIQRLRAGVPNVVVGISGFAGAGKTHLAGKLGEQFAVRDGQMIHLDNLYRPLPHGDGLFDEYDWPLLLRVINDARNGRSLDYQGTDFEGRHYPWRFTEELPPVVIVEGIRLFRPEVMSAFDLSVWIDCPPDLALKRAKARDLSQGHDDEYMKRWDTEWTPKNKEYYETYRPDRLADLVYADYG